MVRYNRFTYTLLLLVLISVTSGRLYAFQKILLAKNGKAVISIVLPKNPSVTQQFAASEAAKYLHQISKANFSIFSGQSIQQPSIFIKYNNKQKKEDYSISIVKRNIIVSGGSDRAILYAVYDFLQRLGCQWLAPDLSLYNGWAEYIPHTSELTYEAATNIYEHPQFTYRKLDVEEGRSHDERNLKQIIDWMPKLRFNILMIPLNYGGSGHVQWDKWRKELTPELKKRDLMIEVGGHGYQNFLNAAMEDKTLFKQHPDWFGKDKNCKPNPSEYLVFNTSNSDAVQYLIANVLQYIAQHPEINIFDFWPPDGARWAECAEVAALGSPLDRQARLVNQVDSAIKKIRPDLRLEMIAYQPVLLPPEKVRLNKNILVDFCPINQSFEKQIYDSGVVNNADYVTAIHSWRQHFSGDIGLYSYYRKYAWNSLPNVIPHYMQRDMQWYAKVPLQGICSYAEPGDWFTYELNHYVLGYLGWNPNVNVDSLISRFCHVRYGTAWKTARASYASLENIVPVYSSIPFTKLKQKEQIAQALAKINEQILAIQKAWQSSNDVVTSANLSRLLLMLQYIYSDLQIQKLRADNASKEIIQEKMKELLVFLQANKEKGVFILSEKKDLSWLMKHYGINN